MAAAALGGAADPVAVPAPEDYREGGPREKEYQLPADMQRDGESIAPRVKGKKNRCAATTGIHRYHVDKSGTDMWGRIVRTCINTGCEFKQHNVSMSSS